MKSLFSGFNFRRIFLGVLIGMVLLTAVPYLWLSHRPFVSGGTPEQRELFHAVYSHLRGMGADFGPIYAEFRCLPDEEEPPQGRHYPMPFGTSHIVICDPSPVVIAHELGHAIGEHLPSARQQEMVDSMPTHPSWSNWEWSWEEQLSELFAADFENTLITGQPWNLARFVLDPVDVPRPFPGLVRDDSGRWVVVGSPQPNH